MTVPAVDPVVADVMRVAELERLLDEFAGAGHVRRAPKDHDEPDDAGRQEKYARKTDFREGVRAAMKDLRHRMLTVGSPAYWAWALTSIPRHERQKSGGCPAVTDPGCTTL